MYVYVWLSIASPYSAKDGQKDSKAREREREIVNNRDTSCPECELEELENAAVEVIEKFQHWELCDAHSAQEC